MVTNLNFLLFGNCGVIGDNDGASTDEGGDWCECCDFGVGGRVGVRGGVGVEGLCEGGGVCRPTDGEVDKPVDEIFVKSNSNLSFTGVRPLCLAAGDFLGLGKCTVFEDVGVLIGGNFL